MPLKPIALAGALALTGLIFASFPVLAEDETAAEAAEEQENLVEHDAEVSPDEPIISINAPDFDYIAREQIMRTALEAGVMLSAEQIDEMATAMADFARSKPEDMNPEDLEIAAEALNQTILNVLTEEQLKSIMSSS